MQSPDTTQHEPHALKRLTLHSARVLVYVSGRLLHITMHLGILLFLGITFLATSPSVLANASNLRPSSRMQEPRAQDSQPLERSAASRDARVNQPSVVHQPRSHIVGQNEGGIPQTPKQFNQPQPTQQPAPEPWVPPSTTLRPLPTPAEIGKPAALDSDQQNQATQATYKATSDNGKGIPLRPPSSKTSLPSNEKRSSWGSLISMIASLCIVIGLFLVIAWGMKRTSGKGSPSLPKEVVQVLGRSQISPRQYLYVLRFGNRLVLVTQQAGQSETLCEIDDPLEVDRICGLCEQQSPNSVTQSFRQVFQQVTSGSPTRNRSKLIG